MFLGMFLPDAVNILRGRAYRGFTPGFNLMFFISAVSLMLWKLPSAYLFADPQRGVDRSIFIYNAIAAVATFISLRASLRKTKPD